MNVGLGSFLIGILLIGLGLLRFANGQLSKKVDRTACHDAQKSIHDKIDIMEKHIGDRFTDLKDFLRNGD